MNFSFLENFKIQDIPGILTGLACYMSQVVIIIIVIWLGYAGIKFMMARGNPESYTSSKKNFYWILIGALVVFGVYTIIVTLATALGYTSLPFLPLACS